MDSLSQYLNLNWGTLEYPWWSDLDANIDIEEVIGSIAEEQPDLIVAKSIGTLFTTLAFTRGLIRPKAIVFLGIPLKSIESSEIDAIRALSEDDGTHFLIVQQTDDILGSYSEVAELFSGRNVTLFEILGNDHMYDQFDILAHTIEDWLNTQLTITG